MTIHDPEPTSEAAARHYNVDTYYRAINNDDRSSFRGTPLKAGDAAPNFRLPTLDGGVIDLAELTAEQHVALVFGSYSAPPTIVGMPAIDAIHQSVTPSASVVFVYSREIHPNQEMPPTHHMLLPHHQTMEQKIEVARQMRDDLALNCLVCVDDLAGTVHRAYGCLPFSATVVRRGGTVVHRQEWASADLIGAVLQNLLAIDEWTAAGNSARTSYSETLWYVQRAPR